MLDRTIAPPTGEISSLKIPQVETGHLSSGIPVHMINSGKHEIILLECIFKSGRWFENIPGVSYFTSKMLLEGSSYMTSHQIAEFFESHGAHVQIYAGADLVVFSVYVLKKNLERVIKVLKEILNHPIFPSYELEILKEIQIQKIKINDKKNNIKAGKEFRALIYGEKHPYGRSLEIVDIEQNINTNSITKFYQNDLLSDLEIIISGKLDQKLINSLEIFSDVSLIPKKNPEHMFQDPVSFQKKITVDSSLQTSIRYGRRIIAKDHGDYIPLVFLNEILGGFFGSRLMKNIREAKGYSYGIRSSLIHQIHDSLWLIGTDVRKEHTSDAIHEIQNEFHKLRTKPIDDDELTMVKNYMLGNFLSSIETSFSLVEIFKEIYFFNLNHDYYDYYIQGINSINPTMIEEIANKYLVDDQFILVTVGGANQ